MSTKGFGAFLRSVRRAAAFKETRPVLRTLGAVDEEELGKDDERNEHIEDQQQSSSNENPVSIISSNTYE
jgi:hypothetical protein